MTSYAWRALAGTLAILGSSCDSRSSPAGAPAAGSAYGAPSKQVSAPGVREPNAANARGTPATVCLAAGPTYLVQTNDSPRICAETARQCLAIDVATGTIREAPFAEPAAPPPLPSAAIDMTSANPAACFEGRCRRLHKRLLAAIRKAQKRQDAEGNDTTHEDLRWREPAATTDLAAVTFGGDAVEPELWDLENDLPIKVSDTYRGFEGMIMAIPIGTSLFVKWTFTDARVYRTLGGYVTSMTLEHTQIRLLDATHWVAVNDDHRLAIFDQHSDERSTNLVTDRGSDAKQIRNAGVAVLADKTIVVALQEPAQVRVVVVDPQRVAVAHDWPVPRCDQR